MSTTQVPDEQLSETAPADTPATRGAFDNSAPDVGSDPTKTFSVSVLISAVRCTLTYVVFPWIFPVIGIAGGIGSGVGIAFGSIAIASNLWSIRRFFAADHKWKWYVSTMNVGVIVLLLILMFQDLNSL